MSFPRLLIFGSIGLFVWILVAGSLKKQDHQPMQSAVATQEMVVPQVVEKKPKQSEEVVVKPTVVEKQVEKKPVELTIESKEDRIDEFFATRGKKLPIVETVSYTSRVPWLKARPAWIADYASHYKTSRHFIARSLNKKRDYISQKVGPGDKFNVLRTDVNIQFYLLVNLKKCTMDFYYEDLDAHEKHFIKSYPVGVGEKEKDISKTPQGKFLLGEKIAVYRPGVKGFYQNERIEMIQVFGTRWIPFEPIAGQEGEFVPGYGIHGVPCTTNGEELIEQAECIGKYESSGCVRLSKDNMEELFSIVVSRPAIIEIISGE